MISDILKKRIESLGYRSLRKFHFDHPEIGTSYELLRQVVYAGRVPRTETLVRIVRAMRFSATQSRKILELCFRGFPSGEGPGRIPTPPTGRTPGEEPFAPEEPGPRPGEPPPPSSPSNAERPPHHFMGEDPEEILASLGRSLPKIPLRGNEDFWDTLRALAALADRKVSRLARREADQPLLFEKEPEAVYHFLVRRGKVPSYMSKGAPLPLAFLAGVDYRERFRGALLGAAVGETMGRSSQGLSPGDVRELFGRLHPAAAPGARGAPTPPFCLLLARSLVAERTLDPEAVASAWAAGSRGAGTERGGEFARNLSERGYPWFEAGTPEAEGAPAARIVPLALLRAGDFRRLKLEAGIAAAITHPVAGAIAGTIAQAAAIARLLHTPPGTLDVIGFARSLSHVISGIEPDRPGRAKTGRPSPTLWRKLGTELTALLLRRAEIEEVQEVLGNGPSVLEGIPFSWACFLRAPDDFAEAVLAAVNLGNSAEENAALAGALAGSYRGVSGIPESLLADFPWREEIAAAADALLALARRETSAS